LGPERGGVREVRFDVGWEESWRGPDRPSWVAAVDNWDAVWVFVKFRVNGGDWRHAGLRAGEFDAPSGVSVDVPADGRGAFVYRARSGYGRFDARGVRLAWDARADRVRQGARVEVRVFAVEMVYVPEGRYSLGSGGSSTSEFRAGGTKNTPFVVSSQPSIALGGASGQLMWTADEYSGSPSGSTSASFPTGFGAFYVMKHQVTQGQYVSFLSTLTQAQADARKHTGSDSRYAISGSRVGEFATSLPFVAANYLSWADGAAFAAWAGLRPMTELEYEKAARGPLSPVPDEFAWGSTGIVQATGLVNAGTVSERPKPVTANAVCRKAKGVQGPVRVGSFAAPGRSRRDAGAGFYGALELSGSLWEPSVTVGNAEGRSFAGTHGDGALDVQGNANVASWPGASAVGAGFRGGLWYITVDYLRVSHRLFAASTYANRSYDLGWRGARSAP
jgi:formylglycine-generating enzyme required for sulfatase activity